jgi:hypothetical protein
MTLVRVCLAAWCLACFATYAQAQTGGAESVIRGQLVDLHAKAISILDSIEKAPAGVARQKTFDEVFALIRLVHRLEEEAAATNLQFLKRGQRSSKELLLIQQAAKAIDSTLIAINSFLETDDRAFIGFARDSNALTWTVRKVM